MRLKKRLNAIDVFCIATGAMISSGLFILPGRAHLRAGPAVCISYLLAGVFAAVGMLNTAELATAMPKAGGDYFYISRSLGPVLGAVSGLISWFALSLKSAFALIGMAAFTSLLVDIDIRIISLALLPLFVAVNIMGVKKASGFQVVLVTGLLALLSFYVLRGVSAIERGNLTPFAPKGVGAILSTGGFVFISYGGLVKVASIAEEVKRPGRNIPLGMFFSLVVVVIFYTAVVLVTSGVLPAERLDGSLTPVTDGAREIMGGWGMILLSIAAILAFVSTANGGIMAASRYPLALSRDGLLPEFIGKVSSKHNTPYIAIVITGAFMAVTLFLEIDYLAKAASTVLLLTYVLSAGSIVVLRESKVENYKPSFKAPFYPWLQIVGICGFTVMIIEMGWQALLMACAIIGAGVTAYWVYGRIRFTREYALLHLIVRIIEQLKAKELVTGSLETELKQILHDRDATERDRFERLVRESTVYDLDSAMSVADLFRLISGPLAEQLDTETETVYDLFVKREAMGGTVISPGLAMPHVVVEGDAKFRILLARAKKGVVFAESEPPVSVILVLIGSRDERHFHLYAISEIAKLIQSPRFGRRWMEAKDEDELRELLLKPDVK